jgi:hypothetical protein
MKKIIIILFVIFGLVGLFQVADAAVRVRGYFRSNGTYVMPSYRSNPDRSRLNNWGAKGNYNPYTGKAGYRSYSSYYRW